MATGKRPITSFPGAMKVGSTNPDVMPIYDNGGYPKLIQSVLIVQNGVTAVSATLKMPPNFAILAITVDVQVAFDSATTAVLSVGTAAGGTQYASGINVKTAGRAIAPATAAQCIAMAANLTLPNVAPGSVSNVVATVTPTGATTVGTVRVWVEYILTE